MRLLASSWLRAATSVGFAAATCFLATSARAEEPKAPADVPPDATRIIVKAPAVIVVEPGDVTIDNGAAVAPPLPAPAPVAVSLPAAPSPLRTHETSHWFGWETLLVDGASVAAGIAAGQSTHDGNVAGAVFFTGYTLGGPVVHWAHGQIGKGFASLGIRVGAPIVLGVTGALAGAIVGGASTNQDDDTIGGGAAAGAAIGVLAGYIGAVVIDSAVLARETVVEPDEDSDARPQEDASNRKSDVKMFNWAPSFGMPKGGGATAGISGTF